MIMDKKIANNLMTANTPMGRAYRNYILDGLTDAQIMDILNNTPNQAKEPVSSKSKEK